MKAADLIERAKRIEVVLTDVDGVWTDGTLYYVPGSTPQEQMVEVKGFNTQDGMGWRWAHAAGIRTGVISGRESPGVTHRAKMLGVTYIYQDYLEKIGPYEEICADAGVTDQQVAYIGDDLPDAPLVRRVGLGVAVANGRDELKSMADYITSAPGGAGAIREVFELILRAQGKWDAVLEKYGLTP